MKGRKILLVSMIVWILSISIMSTVYAGNSLGSGYAVTSNWHGKDVPPGSQVIVTAMTTDADVDQVTFLWKDPDGNTVFGPEVDSSRGTDGEYDGKTVYTFSSTHSPADFGDWGVQALFQDLSDGKTKQGIQYVVSIKATSFFVIPEVPIIGTAGATIAMLLGLGLFAARKRKLTLP